MLGNVADVEGTYEQIDQRRFPLVSELEGPVPDLKEKLGKLRNEDARTDDEQMKLAAQRQKALHLTRMLRTETTHSFQGEHEHGAHVIRGKRLNALLAELQERFQGVQLHAVRHAEQKRFQRRIAGKPFQLRHGVSVAGKQLVKRERFSPRLLSEGRGPLLQGTARKALQKFPAEVYAEKLPHKCRHGLTSCPCRCLFHVFLPDSSRFRRIFPSFFRRITVFFPHSNKRFCLF